MQIANTLPFRTNTSTWSPACQADSCWVLPAYNDGSLPGEVAHWNQTHQDMLSAMLADNGFLANAGQTHLLPATEQRPALCLIGLGEPGQLNRMKFGSAVTHACAYLRKTPFRHWLWGLNEIPVQDMNTARKTLWTLDLLNQHLYSFTAFKSHTDKNTQTTLSFLATPPARTALEALLMQGEAIETGKNLTRNLANTPANHCTPSDLGQQAQQLANQFEHIQADILNESDMEDLGMNGILSISQGSREPARFIVLNYLCGNDDEPPVCLVGKGVTFDSGGISIKPSANMDEMKYDMCGGASVLGVFHAVAALGLPINLVGLIPSVENMPGGRACKPGDVVTTLSGQTVEIMNTDAEGRMLLCDALTYAERFHPRYLIDIATLTGACIVALGRGPSGLISNNDELARRLEKAGKLSHDRVWRLPLWDEYQEQLNSPFADMANIGGREAGSITAGCFLSRFTQGQNWAHLDIAGTAWATGKNRHATGRPVSLLMQFLLDLKQS